MADQLELELVSPLSREIYTIEWIELQSPTGSFFVGPNHSPLVSVLKRKSSLVYKKVNEKDPISREVSVGFFKISDNKALVLLES